MASVVEPSSRPLSLQIETPPSASPFPSPSSSFLPPPMPGPHEFAVKLPPRRSPTSSTCATDKSEKRISDTTTATAAIAASTAESVTGLAPHQYLDPKDIDMLSPTTPTPASMQFSTAGSAKPNTDDNQLSAPQPQSLSHRSSLTQSRPPLSPVLTSSPSLSSTRPAPPSPADSRRISTISLRSAGSNRPASAGVSRSSSRRDSGVAGNRSSTGVGVGIGLAFTAAPPAGGTAAKRQSALSALSAGSAPMVLSPQQEADEPNDATAAAGVGVLRTTTASPVPIQQAVPVAAVPKARGAGAGARRRSTRVKIKIRDFGFTNSDDRYRGMGVDVPKPNRFARLNKKLGGSKKVRPESRRWSTASESASAATSSTNVTSSDDDDDEQDDRRRGQGRGRGRGRFAGFLDDDDDEELDDEDEEDGDGWFRRGMGRFSWSFGFGGLRKGHQEQTREQRAQQEEAAAYPTRVEMEMNFEEEHSASATPESGRSSEVYYDAEDDLDNQGQAHPADVVDEEEPLYPGTYRAAYAFEPEGTAEMRLVEDQAVRVVGRGGGVGWAVVVVPEGVEGGVIVDPVLGVRHALVPEGYLEVVELD